MRRFKSRVLAVTLAAATALTSIVPSAAYGAETPEPAEAAVESEAAAEEAEENAGSGETVKPEAVEEKSGEGDTKKTPEAEEKPAEDKQQEKKEDKEPAEKNDTKDKAEEADKADTEKEAAPEEQKQDEVIVPEEPEEEPAEEEPVIEKHHFVIRFEDDSFTVKVILSSDEGADKDNPSFTVEKKADHDADVEARNEKVKEAVAHNDDKSVCLDLDLEAGEKVTVVAKAEEGKKPAEYSVTEKGDKKILDFNAEEDEFKEEFVIGENDLLFEAKAEDEPVEEAAEAKEPEEQKAQTGTFGLKLASEGGKVSVDVEEKDGAKASYEITRDAKGAVKVTGEGGIEKDGCDFALEAEDGAKITVTAEADEDAVISAFTFTDQDGKTRSAIPEKAEDDLTGIVKASDRASETFELKAGETFAEVEFTSMPEFDAEAVLDHAVVKIHADKGIFPAGTTVAVRGMTDEEADIYTDKAVAMSGGKGYPVMAFDIEFSDKDGKEIQPLGGVSITFEDETDHKDLKVFHAEDGKVQKMEELEGEATGNSVSVVSESFSPFVVYAAGEPDWTHGGSGTRTTMQNADAYLQDLPHLDKWFNYGSHGRNYASNENDKTVRYNARVTGEDNSGSSLSGDCSGATCLNPNRSDVDDKMNRGECHADSIMEVTTPMLIKAVYYGNNGPGSDLVESVYRASHSNLEGLEGGMEVLTHVAVSAIYCNAFSSKTNMDACFDGNTTNLLRQDVYTFVGKLENMALPSNYRVFVAHFNNSGTQDFIFGFEPDTQEGKLRIYKKSNQSITEMSPFDNNYSTSGARFKVEGISGDAVGTTKTLKTGSNGYTPWCTLPVGTYKITEERAPAGFTIATETKNVTVVLDKNTTANFNDTPKKVQITFTKESAAAQLTADNPAYSLKGAEYTIYTNKACTKKLSDVDWPNSVSTPSAFKFTVKEDGTSNVITNLPYCIYYIKETKAPEGYLPDDTVYELDCTEKNQKLTVKETPMVGSMRIIKSSEIPEISDNNECYFLGDAEFTIYTDEACTTKAKIFSDKKCQNLIEGSTVVTDSTGKTPTVYVGFGTYYVKETAVPEGYLVNDEVFGPYVVTKENYETLVKVDVQDIPGNDPIYLTIDKANRDDDGSLMNSLEGAQFTVNYYDEYLDSEDAVKAATPLRSWVIETKYDEVMDLYRTRLNSDFLVSGDELYEGDRIPLGTVAVTETKAAPGYNNDPDFGGGTDMYIVQFVRNESMDGAEMVPIQGTPHIENTDINFDLTDSPIVPEIGTTAVDADTNVRVSMAGGEVTIIDTVNYKNLVAGQEYTMKGTLMDKDTGEIVTDKNGNNVTAEATFTAADATDANGNYVGSVDVTFTFEADETFKGATTVAFEKVFKDGAQLVVKDQEGNDVEIVHEDIDDEDQSIHFPKIGTSVLDAASGIKNTLAKGEQTIVDTVHYENLVPNVEYVITGVLMDKATGEPVLVDGNEVTAQSDPFTPAAAEGEQEVRFTFDTTGMEGMTLVAFEELYVATNLEHKVAEHKDIDDPAQTEFLPNVLTTAADSETGDRSSEPDEEAVIYDEVFYENLLPGKTYNVKGNLTLVTTDEEGNKTGEPLDPGLWQQVDYDKYMEGKIEDLTATGYDFTTEGTEGEAGSVSGSVKICFIVDASALAGKTINVGEDVYHEDVKIAFHADLDDEPQTIYFPKGWTTAIDSKTGIKNVLSEENAVIEDTFHYENLIPGKEYTIRGDVVVKNREEKEEDGSSKYRDDIVSFIVDKNGNPIEGNEFAFTPEEPNGEVAVYFALDTAALEDQDLVVFETLYMNHAEIYVHENPDDLEETTYVPEGRTYARDSETNEQLSLADEEVTIIDHFVFKNLIPGTEYTVTGRVVKKTDMAEVASKIVDAKFGEETPDEEIPEEITPDEDIPEEIPEEGEVTKELSYTEKVVTFVPDASFSTQGGHLSDNCRTFVDRERAIARAIAIVRVKTLKK